MTATIGIVALLLLAIGACLIGFLFGVAAMLKPRDIPPSPRPVQDRPMPLARAGYLPLYQDRPASVLIAAEPEWPAPGDTFSETQAGFQQLERNVIALTQPMRKYGP